MIGGVAATPLVLYTDLVYATIVALAAIFFIASVELLAWEWGIRLPFWAEQLRRTRREHEQFSWASIGFLSILIVLVWLTPIPVALAASAMLAFGDSTSALAGRSLGRHKIWYNRAKSWEGSLTGFAAGFLGALLLVLLYAQHAHQSYPWTALVAVCLVGSFFAMFAESLPRWQDNVTLPVFAGASMTVLWSALGLQPQLGELPLRLLR